MRTRREDVQKYVCQDAVLVVLLLLMLFDFGPPRILQEIAKEAGVLLPFILLVHAITTKQ
jgi:hypothetical protein